MPVEGGGSLEWDEQVALFVSLKYDLLWSRLRSRHSFKALPYLSNRTGSLLRDSRTIHASLPLSTHSVLYNLFPLATAVSPGVIQQSITTHPSTPSSDPAPLSPHPSPQQWAWVFSDLVSQPTAAFPLGQLMEWFQCVGLVHTCKLDTEEASGQGFSTLGDNEEDWSLNRACTVWVEFCLHCLPVVTLGMIFTLCMPCFLYLFWAMPHTHGILVPWPGIPALEVQSLNHWTTGEGLVCSF